MTDLSAVATPVKTIEHLWIPMSDGVRLAARIWMPPDIGAEGVPAIFEYIPYRKGDMVRARDERNHPWLARHGYASLRVDIRGSGDSDGVMSDMYAEEELRDAREVIEWIGRQEWCNGRVGMFGTSWGGTASLQASLDAPPALKAVIAVCATHDRYEDDIHHKGGCLLNDSLEWGATLPAILALPPSPESGDDWFQRWERRLENLPFPIETWVREEARGSYWRRGSVKHEVGRINCPVLAIGGWSDRYSNSVMSLVDACPEKVWGIVGPWGHHYPDQGQPGPAIGFQEVALDWWDHWLKSDSPSEPRWPKLRVWLREFDPPQDSLAQRNGAWIESGPPKGEIEIRPLFLADAGRLSDDTPKAAQSWRIPGNLLHGLASGDTGYFGRHGGLPLDQREDDARAICFETPPLEEDLVIYGSVEVELSLSASLPRSQFCLRLNDVSPAGTSARVGLSMLNLALDEVFDEPREPWSCERRRVVLRFHTKAYRFKAGHRIRLAIGASYWPLVWTPPEYGALQIHDGVVNLPVMRNEPKPLSEFLPPPLDQSSSPGLNNSGAAALKRSRSETPNGEVTVEWHQPLTTAHHHDIRLSISHETRSTQKIREGVPTSAESIFFHRLILHRKEGIAEVRSWLRTTCSDDEFLLDGLIEVEWRGEAILEQRKVSRIERRLS
ncbi:MAG: CocE/NonD family hydrolase [Limibacillus sp.]